ncbi:MAG: hypothetical protein Q7T44_08175 [Parvibaculum sp.]|nr:hypothetical protein [Parvibaculum sp.]
MTQQDWRALTNAEYQRVVASVTALATAALVLPLFFLRDLAGIAEGKPLLPYLSWVVYTSWIFLGLSIFLGVLYQYISAKWIKSANGGITTLSSKALECLLDWTFWLSVIFFLGGVGFLISFASTLEAAS